MEENDALLVAPSPDQQVSDLRAGCSGGKAYGLAHPHSGGVEGLEECGPPGVTCLRKKALGALLRQGVAGLGGLLALVLIALIYGVWRPSDLAPILKSTIRESTMLMMIIGMSLLYSYVMSYLHISQSVAESIVAMHLPRWELLAAILVMVVVLGFFLPPVSIILMTAPIILPPLRAAHFDIIWFGVVMTIVMEMGLIHPPVGLNIFVIRNVAPDIPLGEVIWGTLPFVLLMMAAVVVLCFLPGISTYLPDLVMGPDGGR